MRAIAAALLIALIVVGCKEDKKPDLPNPPPGASNVFLWKPQAESGGKLVVLVPYSLSRQPVGKLTVNGIEGTFSGNEGNGQRAHYRYPQKGASYGNNIKVVLARGKHKWEWTVPNGSQRYEKGFNP